MDSDRNGQKCHLVSSTTYQQANKDDIIECQIRRMEGDGGGACVKPKWVWRANYSTDRD